MVPIAEVEDEIRAACRRWTVREIACDPARWARSLQVLEAERLPVVAFPQSPARMVPATARFYEAVVNVAARPFGQPGPRPARRATPSSCGASSRRRPRAPPAKSTSPWRR